MASKWTDEESAVLVQAAGLLSLRELEERLPGRTATAIRLQTRKLAVGFRDVRAENLGGAPRVWTEEELAQLRTFVRDHALREAAERFGRSLGAIAGVVRYYGIPTRRHSRPVDTTKGS